MGDTGGPGTSSVQLFLARQPILDRSRATVAYELLFRSSAQAAGAGEHPPASGPLDGTVATARVLLHAITETGLAHLVGSRRAFVNLTEELIERPEMLAGLPPDRFVLEVLEHVRPTADVLAGIDHLIGLGFRIAVDDFVYRPELEPLLERAHIVKYDLRQQSWHELRSRVRGDHAAGRRVVVERIETDDELRTACAAGADLFQGYFFARPTVVGARAVAPGRLALLQLLAKVSDPTTTLPELVAVITHDVSLSVKTLRYVNSAATGVTSTIGSIEHAATLLGRDTLRSWTSLMMMAAIDDAPSELLVLALTRAKTCDLLARRTGHHSPGACYTAGILSLLDVMTGTPMDELVPRLSLDDEIADALLGRGGGVAGILDVARRLERVDGRERHDAASLDAHQTAMTWATTLVVSAETAT